MLAEARHIGIWGFGKEGRATFAFIAERYPDVRITVLGDAAAPPADLPAGTPYLGADEGLAALAAGSFDLVVKSPGITPLRPEIAAAKARGTQFTSSTNLWFAYRRRGTVIGITGTKGKSTVASFAACLIANGGHDVRLLGNVGTAAIAEEGGRDATVLELSSYQIADLAHAPDVAAINNLFPEHVPWHGSLEAYYTDKLRLAFIDPAIPLVANWDNAELQRRLAGRPNVDWCNGAGGGYAMASGALLYNGEPVVIAGDLPPGLHNLSNLALAAATVKAAGLLADPLHLDLTGLVALPHRLQLHPLANGCVAVDDSIATVPEATMAALERFSGHSIHLILGGSNRGQDYSALIAALPRHRIAGVWLLPETGHANAAQCRAALPGTIVDVCADLAAAVAGIGQHLTPGDTILLSPAAPSFTQFANFEERGASFVAMCKARWGLAQETGADA